MANPFDAVSQVLHIGQPAKSDIETLQHGGHPIDRQHSSSAASAQFAAEIAPLLHKPGHSQEVWSELEYMQTGNPRTLPSGRVEVDSRGGIAALGFSKVHQVVPYQKCTEFSHFKLRPERHIPH